MAFGDTGAIARTDALPGGDLDERYFRYSVRCDRATNLRIEQAARRAGMTATSFVQRHFETLLDTPPDDTGFSPEVFARRHGVSVQAARLWRAMRDQAGPGDEITAASRYFAAAAKVSQGHAAEYLAELTGAGLVTVLRRPAAQNAGTYRVNQMEER